MAASARVAAVEPLPAGTGQSERDALRRLYHVGALGVMDMRRTVRRACAPGAQIQPRCAAAAPAWNRVEACTRSSTAVMRRRAVRRLTPSCRAIA